VRRFLLGLGVVAGALLLPAAPAWAHAALVSTSPGAGDVVEDPPDEVTLRFSEPVEAGDDAVSVFDGEGRRVDDGDVRADGPELRVGVPDVDDGGYVVTYRVVSVDGHPITGAFTFRVGEQAAAPDESLVARLLAEEGGDPAVGAGFAVARFLAFAGLIVLVGGAAMFVLVWPAGARDRRARAVLWSGLVAAAVGTVASILLEGPYTRGRSFGDAVDASLLGDVLSSRVGLAWLVRLLLLAGAAGLLLAWRHRPPPRALLAATGLALLATPAFSGHATTGRWVPFAVVADVAHVGAASVWIGGLVLVAAAVLPTGDAERLREVVPRFSSVAFAAVVVLVASGTFQGWRQLGSLSDLTDTDYGQLLLAKTLGVVAIVALGALSRSLVRRRLSAPSPVAGLAVGPGAALADPDADTVARLRSVVGTELVIAAVVIALTALLVNADPGRASTPEAFSASADAGGVLVDVSIVPAATGPVDVHVYALEPGGGLVGPVDARAELSLPGRDIPGIDLDLQPAGPGHWSAYDVEVPIAGDWQLDVTVFLTETEATSATFTVPIA
jgi:copper transport protein